MAIITDFQKGIYTAILDTFGEYKNKKSSYDMAVESGNERLAQVMSSLLSILEQVINQNLALVDSQFADEDEAINYLNRNETLIRKLLKSE